MSNVVIELANFTVTNAGQLANAALPSVAVPFTSADFNALHL